MVPTSILSFDDKLSKTLLPYNPVQSSNRVQVFEELLMDLIGLNSDNTAKDQLIDQFLFDQQTFKYPIIDKNTVYFIYRGLGAKNVSLLLNNPLDEAFTDEFLSTLFLPDFCDLYLHTSCEEKPIPFIQIPGIDLFYLKQIFPTDAYFIYAFLVTDETNETTFTLDPLNLQNKVFMPEYEDNPSYKINLGLNSQLIPFKFNSTIFQDRTKDITIYLPPDYDPEGIWHYPVAYFSDGGWYLDEDIGQTRNVLDYLIINEIINPIIAVFVSPFSTKVTWRIAEYISTDCADTRFESVCLSNYAKFLKNELVPYIDDNYLTISEPTSRAHIGVSASGHASLYLASEISETFNLIGMQSPAFWLDPSVVQTFYDFQKSEFHNDFRFYLEAGTYEPGILVFTLKVAQILEDQGLQGKFKIHHSSHEWVLWRATTAQMLEYLFTEESSDFTGAPVLKSSLEANYSIILDRDTNDPVFNFGTNGTIPASFVYGIILLIIVRMRRREKY